MSNKHLFMIWETTTRPLRLGDKVDKATLIKKLLKTPAIKLIGHQEFPELKIPKKYQDLPTKTAKEIAKRGPWTEIFERSFNSILLKGLISQLPTRDEFYRHLN